MKGNRKSRLAQDDRGFAFIVPMTLAIVVGMALLIAGAFIIGTMTSSLEGNFDSNTTLRTSTENSTVSLMGNITTGFANIVDIEIVVIIITALSMAQAGKDTEETQKRVATKPTKHRKKRRQ